MSFEIENGCLKKYMEEEGVTEITLPEHVKTIWYNAFSDCTKLKAIILPKPIEFRSGIRFWGEGIYLR